MTGKVPRIMAVVRLLVWTAWLFVKIGECSRRCRFFELFRLKLFY